MKNQFVGAAGRQLLVETLQKQKLSEGSAELAGEIAATGELLEVPAGTRIIEQGAADDDVYLIVAGEFRIGVSGKVLARRVAGDHLGEMAAILPAQRRAASVTAAEDSVVVKLTGPQIAELGRKYAQIWRCFATELAHRVQQRNALSTAVNEKPQVFLISVAGANEAAALIQPALEAGGFGVVAWQHGVKGDSHTVEHLEKALDAADVAIAVAEGPCDAGARDKVLFELGFFMGRLGRHRAILMEPRGEDLQLPAELAGTHTITWRQAHGQTLAEALRPACEKLAGMIAELGRNR